MKVNPVGNIVIDRPDPKLNHRGTNIVMIYVREWDYKAEPHRRAGGKCYTKEIAPGWIVDFDGDDNPIQIEILNPFKHFPQEILDILPPEFVADDNE